MTMTNRNTIPAARSPFPRWLALLLTAALAMAAQADVEKNAMPGKDGIELFWWPRLPGLPGWQQDSVASFQYGANTLAPAGRAAADAEAIMYAKAQYKPRLHGVATLAELMARDRKDLAEDAGLAKVRDGAGLVSGDGRRLGCLLVEPVSAGNWQRVCYLEEGDYYLVFALNARSRKAFDDAMKDFKSLVEGYRQ